MDTKILNHLSFIPGFNEFWGKYPRKEEILRAYCSYQEAMVRASVEEIAKGLEAHNLEMEKLGVPFICEYAHRWLNRDGWK